MKNTSYPSRPARPPGRLLAIGASAAGLYAAILPAAHAASRNWDGSDSAAWETAANWGENAVPTSADVVFVATTGTMPNFPVISTSGQAASELWLGAFNGNPSRLDVTGGDFTVSTLFFIAPDATSNATLNQSGGTVAFTSAGNSFNIATGTGVSAQGTYNLSGGTLSNLTWFNIGSSGTGTGTFNQSGGTVDAATSTGAVNIGDQGGVTGILNVSGGTFNSTNTTTNGGIVIGNHWTGSGTNNGTLTVSGTGLVNTGENTAGNGLKLASGSASVGTVNLDGGAIQTAKIQKGAGTGTFNFNGGTLRAMASNATFMTGLTNAYVKAGGALIDTNSFDVTIGQALTADPISTGGGLTKLGSGTLTLAGLNTYTGNTTVSEGTLALADNASLKFVIGTTGVNNKITGTGTFAADGDFEFDLASASTTVGATWQIVDVSTLAETFGGTFTVTGFAANSGTWVKPANGTFYEFSPTTGVLRVIADPGISYPAPTVTLGAHNNTYVIDSTILLQVSARGTGELTYQWYYQATAEDTPTAIPDATEPSLTISDAQSSAGGIYSVIVTDHAAEASGLAPTTTTATFPLLSVVPAPQVSLAYYRFEEGANATPITSALDSVGGNHLTTPGAPTYSSGSIPATRIPATGATNTLGANFPAADNHGLVASTSGTLADTVLTNFTIEAYVRHSNLSGWQTYVGRDDSDGGANDTGQGTGDASLIYFQKTDTNSFRISLVDRSNVILTAGGGTAALDTWYHLAAVGDAVAGTLTFYVNGVAVGSTTGFTGLYVPTSGSNTPWTVGRGDFNGADTDLFRGDIDEVRISHAALPPSQFLNSSGGVAVIPPTATISPAGLTARPGGSATYTVTAASQMGGTLTYQWYKGATLLTGETGATLTLTGLGTDADGTYSVLVTDSAGTAAGTPVTARPTALLRVIDAPDAARAIGLNFVGTGSGTAYSAALGSAIGTESAGFVPAANWNNSASVTGVASSTSPLAVLENTGATPSYATAAWTSAGTWSARAATGDPATEKTPDARLFHGYIESRAATGSSVTVSNIPYASYDVYVYVVGGTVGNVGTARIDRVGAPIYYYKVIQHDSYVPAVTPTTVSPHTVPWMIGEALDRPAALAAPAASFVRFAGVTGPDLTVTTIDSVPGANSGGIAAVQIVDRTPAGAAYPPTITAGPVSLIKQGGASATFSVSAMSSNSGGTISYQWRKDGADIGGQTSATLSLSNLTGSASGTYGVVVTETAPGLGSASTTRTATLVVVDATRPLLINGDVNTAGSPTYVGDGILRADGTQAATNVVESNPTVWNGILGAAGGATRVLAKESTGLALPGVTFTYAGATGVEDNTTGGGGVVDPASELERDYLYAAAISTTPLTGSVGGLQALAGKQVTLLVYAVGKTAKAGTAYNSALVNDTANVALATANNHLASPTGTTTVLGVGGSEDAGRNIEFNNPYYYGAETYPGAAYVAFTGVVAADGTVAWSITPDTSPNGGGLAPLVGFQLLVTATDIAPAVPAGLSATAGSGQVGLSWAASGGATGYTVKRATSIAGPYAAINPGAVTGTSYTDTNVTAGATYYYTVAAANGLAQSADSAPVSAMPTSSVTELQAWRQTYFNTTANSGDAANTADPDGDGQSNLLEYALGTTPTASNALAVTVARSGDFLTLSFNHIGDTTLVYMIEASDDLVTWSTVRTYPEFSTTGGATYTDTVSFATQARRFLRLVVTTP